LTAEGNLRPIADVMLDLGQATQSLPNAARLALFQDMFDLRGMTAGMKLSSSVEEMDRMSAAIDNSGGAAAETAKKMDNTLGGTFRRIMSAVEGVQISIGEALAPAFRLMEGNVTAGLGVLTAFVERNQQAVYWLGGMAVALIGAGATLVAMGAMAKVAAVGIGVLQGAIVLMHAAAFAPLLGPTGLIIAGLGIVTAAWLSWTESGQAAAAKIGAALGEQKAIFGETFAGIQEAIAAGDYGAAVDILMAGMAASWHQGLADILGMTGGFAKGVLEVFVGIASVVSKIWADMQTGIAKQMLDWAGSEGVLGDAMRQFLGVDPREKTATDATKRQQRQGLSFKVSEWRRMQEEAGGDEARVAELEGWIQQALADMQDEYLGLTPEQIARGWVGESQALLDEANAQRQSDIDQALGGVLSGFDSWANTAEQRAADARASLSAATGPKFAGATEEFGYHGSTMGMFGDSAGSTLFEDRKSVV
jgi:hypothetical protein